MAVGFTPLGQPIMPKEEAGLDVAKEDGTDSVLLTGLSKLFEDQQKQNDDRGRKFFDDIQKWRPPTPATVGG